ncbi:hypothetical protein ACFXOS_26060 [Streptomyces sp. NPDC059175]|uniref:hypothetical protein n=1 Tax=Streptomyces sp. NPDC059175 TaxID=3346757 RepID=UPI003698C21C
MSQTWGLSLSQLPSWEATTEAIDRRGLRTMKAQQLYLTRVWSQAERRLRRGINRLTRPQVTLAGPVSLRAAGTEHRQYQAMALALQMQPLTQASSRLWPELEDWARTSLARAVDAFNFLEDTDLAELAHQHAHHVAALVGGIFGCDIEYSEDSYWDTCPLSLMHRRSGLSIGFTAIRLCSLCGKDLDECEHLLDTRYPLIVRRTPEGTCNACGRRSCPHTDGQSVLAYPCPVIAEGQIHEVSLVSRPRDPLARFTKIEFHVQELAHSLGQEPNGQPLRCFRCLHPCEGFSGQDAACTELPSGRTPDRPDPSAGADIVSASQGI